ncbi:MAG: dockerin type I domain-containing protein [Firmicutes bacterium]|nr:dockerin type I domain-containing protein [Bacillota bacterium]
MGGYTTAYNNGTIQATATINGGSIYGGVAGVVIYGDTKNTTNYGPILTVNGGEISGESYGIAGNGSSGYGPTFIYINGGTISGNTAIYHPQKGTIEITEADSSAPTVINGATAGVQMCSGDLTVSGGTITVSGGGDTSGKTGDGSIPDGAAVSAISRSYPGGDPSVTITGGTFVSANASAVAAYTWSNNSSSTWANAPVTITGGKYSDNNAEEYVDTSTYIVMLLSDENYLVTTASTGIASTIEVEFEKVSGNTYNINLVGSNSTVIYRFLASQLAFEVTPENGAAIGYTIAPADGISLTENDGVYAFNLTSGKADEIVNSGSNAGITNTSITIGTVTFTGIGTFEFGVKSADPDDTNKVQTAVYSSPDNNIVRTYVPGSTTDILAVDSGTGSITLSLDEVTLTINVVFPNSVDERNAAYTDMQINLSNALGDSTIYLGSGASNVTYDKAAIDGENYNAYIVTATVPKSYATTLEFVGAGYRTYRTSITPTDDAAVTVWNNAMDSADTVVISADDNAMGEVKTNVTFLAGDIVLNNKIDLWDLSAVVSYFGKQTSGTEIESAWDYTMYDLNRDGKVDSRDIAMVLVSWDY